LLQTISDLGHLAVRRGEFQQAISVLERGLELCRVWSFRVLWLTNTARLGYAYTLSGQISMVLPLLDQVVEQGAPLRAGALFSSSLVLVGEAYLLAGRLEEARTCAGRVLQLSREYKERGVQADTLRLLGDIAMHRDPPDVEQADTHYQQALTLATELGMRPLQAHCHRGLGTLYRQTGQSEQARAELTTAIEMYRDMEMTFWLPQAEVELADVEGR
jgi:tetratricopeptide (TPR) repeat protein